MSRLEWGLILGTYFFNIIWVLKFKSRRPSGYGFQTVCRFLFFRGSSGLPGCTALQTICAVPLHPRLQRPARLEKIGRAHV